MTLSEYVADILGDLPEHVRHLPILAGGALRAYFDKTPVKDYDLFFRSADDYLTTLVALGQVMTVVETDYPGANVMVALNGRVFNLVGFMFLGPWEQIDRFDFRCCQIAAWQPATYPHDVLVAAHYGAALDAQRKRLIVLNNNGEERTLKRIKHYIEDYGYTLEGVEVDEPAEPGDTAVPIGTAEALRSYIRSLPSGRGGYP